MKLSLLIVVPTLNSFSLLPRLISSLQKQDWSHWRVLFIDGPSCPEHRIWLQQCCSVEARCSWVIQNPKHPGIFGAMNQGFAEATPHDWVLFWGSDDWAAGPSVLTDMFSSLKRYLSQGTTPDLIVCKGRYAASSSGELARATEFQPPGVLGTDGYRRALWLGSSPPHQATLFGPGARRRLPCYCPGFRLSADLDYFLQLSTYSGLRVHCVDIELVHMADSGVSGQQTLRRLKEVFWAYWRAFAWRWCFPFVARYIRRLASLFPWR